MEFIKNFIVWFIQDVESNCFTLVTVVLSGFISWIISKRYFDKGNRVNFEMSVILPIEELMKESYTEYNYKRFCDILRDYSVKYMRKEEKKVFDKLRSAYKAVYLYKESSVNAGIVFEYFKRILKENNVKFNPIPVIINDEIVDYEPPQGMFELQDDLAKVFMTYDLQFEQEECQNAINNLLGGYSKHYLSEKKISFFEKQTLSSIIEKDDCTKKWDEKFETMEKAKKAFLELKVTKKLQKEINNRKDVT